MLADGASLVLSVVPQALLEMSRGQMRATLSTVCGSKPFWKLLAISLIVALGTRSTFRHMDATFPKYFMRMFGDDAPFEWTRSSTSTSAPRVGWSLDPFGMSATQATLQSLVLDNLVLMSLKRSPLSRGHLPMLSGNGSSGETGSHLDPTDARVWLYSRYRYGLVSQLYYVSII